MKWLYGLTLITAFASFLQEVNLAQALSGSLGGTILRYHTGFGLFTCFLGLGAWAYGSVRRRFSSLQILFISQAGLALLAMAGPWWIRVVDPLARAANAEPALTVLSYLPLLSVAFISGLELPALMELGPPAARTRILAADYVGMFAASVAYPTLLLRNLGVPVTGTVVTLCNFLAMATLMLFLRRRRAKAEGAGPSPTTGPGAGVAAIAVWRLSFLLVSLAFCSMGYELLTAKAISDLILDEVLAHSVTIGVFLVGLGLGTLRAERGAEPLRELVWREGWLIFAAALALPALLVIAIAWETNLNLPDAWRGSVWALLPMVPVPLLLGFLAGFELPLLLHLWPEKLGLGPPLALNYFGALIAGFVVPLYLLPSFGPGSAFILLALLNLALLGLLTFDLPRGGWRRTGLAAMALSLLLAQAVRWNPFLEQLFLQTHYFELRAGDWRWSTWAEMLRAARAFGPVRRITSRYQTIDVVDRRASGGVLKQDSFTLYLNRQPQFSSDTWRMYHESLIAGGINLAGHPPAKVLILGGGDGLLAGQILATPGVREVTLVELDPAMIELANEMPDLTRLNHHALSDPRLNLIVGDAFRFVHRAEAHFDAIFIDFPYPNNFELSRLFSVEFYRALRLRLAPGGFLVMDAPIWLNLDDPSVKTEPHEVLFNTLAAAGFAGQLAYGPIEPFLFAATEARPFAFDYARLPSNLSNRTFVNLTSLDFLVKPYRTDPKYVNSIYHPLRFLN